MPRRYRILYEKARTVQDEMVDYPVVSIPRDEESVFPPVVYGCDRCGRRYYSLREFVDHLTLKHLIPPSQAWRYVTPKEVR
ncbi:MAG: hypothetical protein QXE50_05925 [Nitrososphaerota archaeon]